MLINDFLHYRDVPAGTNGERTIFGKKEPGLEYAYSDRLVEWDYDASEKAANENDQRPHTSEWYEKYLTLYYKRPIRLVYVAIGIDIPTGYDYKVFGFKYL